MGAFLHTISPHPRGYLGTISSGYMHDSRAHPGCYNWHCARQRDVIIDPAQALELLTNTDEYESTSHENDKDIFNLERN